MIALGNRITAGLVGSALVLGGVAAAAPAYASSGVSAVVKSDTRFDARTVFRGAFFGHGPVAALIPQYFEGIPAATAATEASENNVMAEVERRTPGAIDRFYQAVRSGSHVRTKQAVQSVVGTLREILVDETSSAKPGDFSGECVAIVIAVAIWTPIAIWTAITLPKVASGQISPVATDNLVHDLVTKLA